MSPFATHRGRLVRRVLIGIGVLAVALFFVSQITSGDDDDATAQTQGYGNTFTGNRAPRVAPPVADPYAAGRQAAERARQQQAATSPQEQQRYDAAIAAASKFAAAYATYSADAGPQSYVEGLPGASAALRANLLTEATNRWSDIAADETVAVARVSGQPAEILAIDLSRAQLRVQVIQDITATSGQKTNTLTYRVDLEWTPPASAGPGPVGAVSPSPSGTAGAGPLTGVWTVTGVRVE